MQALRSVSVAAAVAIGCGLDPVPDPAAGTGGSSSGGGESSTDAVGTESTGAAESTGGETMPPAGPDAAPDPSTFGPYPVGVRTFAVVDDSRGEDEPRELVVEVWYPATEDARDLPTVTYGPEDILRPDALAALSMELDVGLATDAVRDATVRETAGPFPVVMFSHGSGGIRMQSTYLTVALASHGYMVVAPDHIGNTLSDIVVDGGLSNESMVASLAARTVDLDFLVDHFRDGGERELSDAMDLSRLGVAGHSFGALTSVRWVGRGAKVQAAVAQAPPPHMLVWLGIPTALSEFDVPIQLQVGGLDLTTPPEDADSVWEQMSPPRSRMDLANAGHFSFSDICGIDAGAILDSVDLGLADALDDGCTEANADFETGAAAMRNFAIGHFNVHLRDSEPSRAFLDEAVGQSIVSAELTYLEER